MQHTLKDKVAIIAGGAKNLGGLVSRDLAKQGCRGIVVHYHSDGVKADAEKVVADIKELGKEVILVSSDLSKPSNITTLFDTAIKQFGGVDIAINTAGMIIKKPIINTTEEDYDKIFAINAKAAFFFIKEAGKKLNDGGKICTLVTSLLAAYTGGYAIYPGSKAPVEHYTRAASKEFGSRCISVNAVAPGPMETPFFYGQEDKEAVRYNQTASALSAFTKTGLTNPADIVTLIRYLVGEGWWITGQTIFANGGYTTR